LCARATTACVIVYDNVSDEGVFAKSSKINVKSAASLLTKDFKKEFPLAPDTLPLANLIRVCTSEVTLLHTKARRP
jgi:hypothetical protein